MTRNITLSALLAILLLGLAGCESYRNTMRSFVRSTGAVQISDMHEADYVARELPFHLGVKSADVSAKAGSHTTELKVRGIPTAKHEATRAIVEEWRKTHFAPAPKGSGEKRPIKPIKVRFSEAE
jgi:hypothetical protein